MLNVLTICVYFLSICRQRGLQLLPLIMKRVYNNPSVCCHSTTFILHTQYEIDVIFFIVYNKQYSVLKSPSDDNSAKVVANRSVVIVKPMDLSMLMKNIASYKNFEQFLADVEWMVHNCIILYTKLHLKTRTARVLLEYLTQEIGIAKMCTDCYRSGNTHELGWFTRVCQKPHLIVWTKRCDHNYWPAKVAFSF